MRKYDISAPRSLRPGNSMNVCGLTDSLANVLLEAKKCRKCGGVSHLANGLCLACLMQAGLDNRDEENIESFESTIARIDIHDSDWRIGSYEILEEIARGGMGVVYRARQQFSRRIVALKRVLSYHSDSTETLARFRREAEAASALDHPNILPIYEVGESADGLPFFAMKFAPGGSLREVGPALHRSPGKIVPLMLQVARAIESAHAQGLLHRDLKPGNILLDGRGEPLVCDFGLAKWLADSSDLTQTLTVFGTPGYIAPEQARGPAKAVGPAADIYSLGAILFDLLAGRPPFLGEHALSVVTQAMQQPAPRLRSVVSSIDRDLETICARCLERDPSARYSSAGSLANDLERWLHGESISARPLSVPVRMWRRARRNPALVACGAVCLFLASLSGAKFWESYQSEQKRNAAWQHSVTVLPFLDLDNASVDNVTANNVATAFQSQFSRIGPSRILYAPKPDLLFAAAPRAEEIAAVAQETGVRAVLTGTKRLVNGVPVFSLNLVDPTKTSAVLTKTISGGAPSDLIQKNVSEFYDFIGTPLKEPEQGTPQSRSVSDFITAGRSLMDRRTVSDSEKAIDCFKKAIAIDPSSALAHAFLAIAQRGHSFLGGKPELAPLAETSARKAIELDPRLGLGHRALSAVLEQKGEFAAARDEVLRAIELDGIDERAAAQIAAITKTLGRPDIALKWYRIMRHLQIQPAVGEFMIGDCWADLCEDERAEQAYLQTTQLRPELPEGWMGLCRLRILKGDFAGAMQGYSAQEKNFSQFDFPAQMMAQLHFFAGELGKARKIYSELALKDPQGGGNFYGAISYQSALGWLHLAAGETEIGRKILNRALQHELAGLAMAPRHPEILYRTAAIEASLGLQKPALAHLRSAVREGWIDFRSLGLDPRFANLRSDPAFREISESIATKVASLRRSMPADSSGKRKVE